MAIVEPMVRQVGIDIIWFGIFIVVEMAQIMPPIGFNLLPYGMTNHDMSFIEKTALPMFFLILPLSARKHAYQTELNNVNKYL